jgi:hypothetical protein
VVPLNKKLLPQNHPAHENKHLKLSLLQIHWGVHWRSQCYIQLIEDHLSVFDARLFRLTFYIATLRENPVGYICINPRYWWDRTLAIGNEKQSAGAGARRRWWRRLRFGGGGGEHIPSLGCTPCCCYGTHLRYETSPFSLTSMMCISTTIKY